MRRTILILMLILTWPSASGAWPLADDDAGSGADAPASPQHASPLAPGAYRGNLTPPWDVDWFHVRRDTSGVACVEANLSGASLARVTLSTNVSLGPRGEALLTPLRPVVLGLATPHARSAYLGLGPSSAGVDAGQYGFDVRFLTREHKPEGDAGTGRDAGNTTATAIPVGAGCLGGELHESNDTLDAFVFAASEGTRVTLSLVNGEAPLRLRLVSPTQQEVAAQDPGEVGTHQLNESGDWTLFVSAPVATTSTYLLGITLDEGPDPEPRPCRPMCVTG